MKVALLRLFFSSRDTWVPVSPLLRLARDESRVACNAGGLLRLDAGLLDDLRVAFELALEVGAPFVGLGGARLHALGVELGDDVGIRHGFGHLVAQALHDRSR